MPVIQLVFYSISNCYNIILLCAQSLSVIFLFLAELSKLKLVRLDFSYNKVSVIPPAYRLITSLSVLELAHNPLTSPPAQVSTVWVNNSQSTIIPSIETWVIFCCADTCSSRFWNYFYLEILNLSIHGWDQLFLALLVWLKILIGSLVEGCPWGLGALDFPVNSESGPL